jgi:protein-disulfide isomerase
MTMRLPALLLTAVSCLALTGCGLIQNEKAFGDRVRAYLITHPEVIEEAINRLQEKQAAEATQLAQSKIAENRQALEHDGRDFVGGNPKGTLTLVEFFDYRCGYCKAAQPQVAALLKANPDIRLVYKEFPILPDRDGRIGVSLRAARAALAAGALGKYGAIHEALMAEKALDDVAIAKILTANGIDPAAAKGAGDADKVIEQLTEVHSLGVAIGIQGTPAFIVGDQLIPGADMEALTRAIDMTRAKQVKPSA